MVDKLTVESAYSAVEAAAKGISQMGEREAQEKVFRVMDSLPKDVARKIAKKFKIENKKEQQEIWTKRNALLEENKKLALGRVELLDKEHPFWVEIAKWGTGEFVLQRCLSSAIHRLEEASAKANFLHAKGYLGMLNNYAFPKHTFVVEHDWSKAFEKAENIQSGEYQLPYEFVSFEFKISGRHVCVFTNKEDMCAAMVEFGKYWVDLGSSDLRIMFEKLYFMVLEQIRIMCIVLDAEVAESEVIRAPHKLNQSREKSGKLPLYDYHIVKLANRKKYSPLPDGHIAGEGRERRMHFVRGHWRHYSDIKTWIKWHVRGNPDLGFVDKEYRL